jgi:hypothetical protein
MYAQKHRPIDASFAWKGADMVSVPGSRQLPKAEGYEVVLGSIEPGAVRGGVPCSDGWWRDVAQFVRGGRAGAGQTVK